MLQLAPRGEIAVPILELEALSSLDVKEADVALRVRRRDPRCRIDLA
jgi:hypothetical protein